MKKEWEASNKIPSDKAFFDNLLHDPAFYKLPAWQEKIKQWKETCKQYPKTAPEYKKARANLKKTSVYLKRAEQKKPDQIHYEEHQLLHEWHILRNLLKDCKALEDVNNIRIESLRKLVIGYDFKHYSQMTDYIISRRFRKSIGYIRQLRKQGNYSDKILLLNERKRYD